ncbi:MAG TPA: PadR family transcriptional regulator [Kofleriaceae bacterium]|nr:PadR family transcriptional regulator [Kofleriaceae bacterium]
MPSRVDVPKGTLDLMILKALAPGEKHGYGLATWIRTITDGTLDIDDGALYPALHRLEWRGYVASEWGVSDNNRRAKFYALTADGRRRLRQEVSAWTRFSDAMWKIVNAEPAVPAPRAR